jgi:hypothetical protein
MALPQMRRRYPCRSGIYVHEEDLDLRLGLVHIVEMLHKGRPVAELPLVPASSPLLRRGRERGKKNNKQKQPNKQSSMIEFFSFFISLKLSKPGS